jgi:pimeloyl-ACP methyl ester carboxylesterase
MQETIKIKIDDLIFDCRTEGNKENELVIFLHGWPETSYMWKKLMTDLSKKGFYCIAPNLRGFSKNACPKGKQNYTLNKLANDIMGISKHFARSKFHLVGHDWGAVIGWKVVHDNKNAILSWSAISVPHIQSFGDAIVNNKEQRKMSQYVRAFQWPYLPEMKIRKNDFELFRKLWKNSSLDEIEDYLKVFGNRKQLTASINYYRSNYKLLKKAANDKILGDVYVPTLFIWGNKDMAIGSVAVENSHKYMKNDYLFLELDSGHWLIQTKFNELKIAITEHILKYKNST